MKDRETLELEKRGEFHSAIGSQDQEIGASHPVRQLPLMNEERFEIAGERARGGAGLVLEATDRLLGRRVALKQPQQQDPWHEARFLREALITARLQHPAIVPIYDLGVRPSGEPCYSMRLVPGATLRDAIVGARGLDDRLALLPHVQAVADAVAYAHEQRIVHRDLKPANVLVGPFGETVVIDWGLAKDLRGDPTEPQGPPGVDAVADGPLTRTGTILGTPAYMAPEQARGEPVDQTADVYAIGAMLYHLLTGEAPYRESTSLAAVIDGPPPAVDLREPGIPRDLVAIVGKAMARQRSDRYASAQALAADLKRFATGQLVGARRYSAWALARRWLQRHLATAIVAGALIAALFAGAVGIVRATNRTAAENNRLRLKQAQAVLKEDPTAAVAWLETHQLESGHESDAVEVAARAAATGVARYILRLPDDTPAKLCLSRSGQLVGVLGRQGAIWLFDVARGTRRRLGSVGATPAGPCLFMDQDRRLIVAGARGDVMMAPVPDGPASVLLRTRAGVGLMQPLDDARVVVQGRDTRLHVVSVDGTGARLLQPPADYADTLVAPDGKALYTCDERGGLWRIDLEGGPPRLLDKLEQASFQMDFSPDGRTLVLPSPREIGLRDLATGQTRWRRLGAPGSPTMASLIFGRWSAGGVLFVGGEQSAVRWWDPRTDEELTFGVRAYLAPPMVTADRERAVWIDREGTIYILDVQSRLVRTLVGHQTSLRGSAMTPDGRWLAVTHGGAARLFALPPPPPWRQDLRLVGGGRRVVPAGRELIAVVGGQSLVAIDQRSGVRRPLHDLGRRVHAFAVSGQGKRAAVTDPDGGALVVDLDSGKTTALVAASSPVDTVDFVGEDRLVGLELKGDVHVWDLDSGAHRIALHLPPISPGDFTPGVGGYVNAARMARRVLVTNIRNALLLDLDTNRATPIDFGNTINHRMISADGRVAVGGRFDGAVVFAEPDGQAMRTRLLTRRPGFVQDMAFTPDQRALFVGDETGAIARVEVATGATHELGRHLARLESLALSPSGRLVASSDLTGEVRIWEPSTGALLASPRTGVSTGLEFAGEDRLISYGRDGWMQVTTIDPAELVPATPAGLSRRLAELTTARIDASGEPISY